MLQARTATMADREQIRALWDICFADSQSFTDWFFLERYFPSLTSCLALEGNIVSALQSYPIHVRVRGKILNASMLAGVSTHPAHGGKGYMRSTFLHYMQNVRAQGIPIAVHTPAHMETFFSRGHYPAADTCYLDIASARAQALPPGVRPQSMQEGLAPLHTCYQLAFAGFSGMVSRSIADHAFKFRDYAADDARCMALWEGDTVRGYCVYYALPDRLHAEEVAARDADAYCVLIEALCHVAAGRSLHAKLPPTLALEYPGAHMETRAQGAMGVADVGALLGAVWGDSSIRLAVQDESVPQNAGVWNGAGARDGGAPHIALQAGRLGQLLCGYASLDELVHNGWAEVHDAGAARAIEAALPKLPCFIVDEY